MAENQIFDYQFVQGILTQLDDAYRRAARAENRLAKLSDAEAMEKHYEEQLADKDKQIADKDKQIAEQQELLDAQERSNKETFAR